MFNCFNLAARKQICVYKNMENLENPYTTMSRETNFQKFENDPPSQYEQATSSISYKAKNVPKKMLSNKETTSFLKPFQRTKCWIAFLVAWLVVVTILLVLLCLYVFIHLKGLLENKENDLKVCPVPEYIAYGQIQPNKTTYVQNDVISFECLTGYQLNGNHSATCLESGNWSLQFPNCSKIVCPSPLNIIKHPLEVEYKFGEEFNLTCKSGYYLCGNKTSECTESGWSSSCLLTDLHCKANLDLYHIGKTKMTWQDAQIYCQSIGGDLITHGMRVASIRKEIIDKLFKPIDDSNENNVYWIGLNDIDREGHFVYVDGVYAGNSNTDFRIKEPNGHEGKDEDCVVIRNIIGYFMNDEFCTGPSFPVCEFPCKCN